MCGRYALDCTAGELEHRLTEIGLEYQNTRQYTSGIQPSYNIAPTQTAPVYTHHKDLKDMKWGLIPHWVKDISKSQPYKTFNARCENIATSKMWTAPSNYKRCVVPASGYYEWQTKGKTKIPYYVTRRDREVMFMAGMYDYVPSQDLYTYTIITAPAPPNMEWLHMRMPVVLNDGSKEWDAWLDDSKTQWDETELQSVLQAQCNEDELEWWQVNPDVGKVSNNGKHLTTPANSAVRNFFKQEGKTTESLAKLEDKPNIKNEEGDNSVKVEKEEEERKPFVREKDGSQNQVFGEQHAKLENETEPRREPHKPEGSGKTKHATKRKACTSDVTQMLRNSSRKRAKR
ncbi:LANO_0D07272g1_1 [Lachancea nothofagi CBS 11611]|uniref:LANO_0D07272g1_1 n=1 Tax=Lachancea nothofagi CBS 11611 TaxID=1266666 RepID=A0A1G4JHY3_9SACH|nr:LANO_0D07272g1_1 [Lachancea nothofagi CBS 11611]